MLLPLLLLSWPLISNSWKLFVFVAVAVVALIVSSAVVIFVPTSLLFKSGLL